MAKVMLIDATHPEETRVAVVDGRKLEEFDVEVASRRPLKGNIYLAKVTRVEPSLQAAFVEYGGNRHGFLAFSEIHPDYYRIPVADREKLLREAAAEEDEDDEVVEGERAEQFHDRAGEHTDDAMTAAEGSRASEASFEEETSDAGAAVAPSEDSGTTDNIWQHASETRAASIAQGEEAQPGAGAAVAPVEEAASASQEGEPAPLPARASEELVSPWEQPEPSASSAALETPRFELRSAPVEEVPTAAPAESDLRSSVEVSQEAEAPAEHAPDVRPAEMPAEPGNADGDLPAPAEAELVEVQNTPEVVDVIGGEEPASQDDPEVDEEQARRRRQRNLRRYKIQEVIKRRQILLVQVTKEERGNKGAALTTYLSLAGRYCVLMPNTDRGGGISRRITSVNDRKRLKSIVDDLDAPEGMAVIVRTAGMERNKQEIKRDFEYLLRLWDEIREVTLKSTAPALIYEEASLIKRSIRDLYTRDIGDIIVAGEDAYQNARAFMHTLTPSHTRRVQSYRDHSQPLFQRHQIESQIAAIHEPVVHLKSGGYIVLNQTEALVAIDVNSGRATRERNIEETALRTNIEAAEEIARQLRLRDLAGLIVIDFIDMEENRNNAQVERRLKEALKNDRARIQIGRISTFGLLEMSRQRLHPSLVEASTEACAHCHGTGRVRSVESTALHVLRMAEEEIARSFSPGVTIFVPSAVALFMLNHKRRAIEEIEQRRGVRVYLQADDELTPPEYRLDRIKQLSPGEEVQPRAPQAAPAIEEEPEDILPEEPEEAAEAEAPEEAEEQRTAASGERERGGRRRRRRRGRSGKFRADEFTEGEASEESQAPAVSGEQPEAPTPMAARSEETEDEIEGDEDEEDTEGAQAARGREGEEAAGVEGDQPRRRRRRGRRGGRRRSRRPERGQPAGEVQAQPEGWEDRPQAGEAAEQPIPGLGDQPELPEMPEQWAQRVAPVTSEGREPSETEAAAEGNNGEPQAAEPQTRKRQRRPRRREEEAAAPPAEAIDVAPKSREQRAATEQTGTVQIIEVGGQQQAASEEGQRKRGWWRRLIE
ncbi:Rne/Rng family ribonuclease [Dongia deserti]|uniref:Rne/Rng family ribonuclease n=1 Tax=Dongia deserti TaxID=2268030 RepID=UPI0025487E98|nr:Rne/Rng family ribonuclease [Dongia deserti]